MIQVQAKVEIVERDGEPVIDPSTISPNLITIKQCISFYSHNQDKDLVIIGTECGFISVKTKDLYAALKAVGS